MPNISSLDYRDLLDLALIAADFGLVARCPGGRAMVSGYCCNHCGRDTSIKGQTCGAPFNADGSPSKRIPPEVLDG